MNIELCELCDNMMYIIDSGSDDINDESSENKNNYKYQCKYCNNTKKFSEDNNVISVIKFGDSSTSINQITYDSIKYDVTLPRTKHVKCQNSACQNKKNDTEVILIRNNKKDSTYTYYCTKCEQKFTKT